MQKILLAAFLRGIGGGLALAATPYILAAGHGAVRGTARGRRSRARLGRGCRRLPALLRRAPRPPQDDQAAAEDLAAGTRRLRGSSEPLGR